MLKVMASVGLSVFPWQQRGAAQVPHDFLWDETPLNLLSKNIFVRLWISVALTLSSEKKTIIQACLPCNKQPDKSFQMYHQYLI